MYRGEWVDPAGTVHVWIVGTGETVCGRAVGLHTETPRRTECPSCASDHDSRSHRGELRCCTSVRPARDGEP